MDQTVYPRFLFVMDDFYDNPNEVVSIAQAATYYEPEHCTGFRSTCVYHETGIVKKLERILEIKINRFYKDPLQENGVFYQGFSTGKRKEVPGVHSDWPYNDITVLIYLTEHLPFDCGTSLWQHKRTGLTDQPTTKDAGRLKMKRADVVIELELDRKDRSKWIEIDRAGHRFNRMVAYPSGVLHSATKHYGDSMQNGRIYQTLRIGVDWNSFKLKSPK